MPYEFVISEDETVSIFFAAPASAFESVRAIFLRTKDATLVLKGKNRSRAEIPYPRQIESFLKDSCQINLVKVKAVGKIESRIVKLQKGASGA